MQRLVFALTLVSIGGCDCFDVAYRDYQCRDAGACDGGAGGGKATPFSVGISGDDVVTAHQCTMAAIGAMGPAASGAIDVRLGFDGGETHGKIFETCPADAGISGLVLDGGGRSFGFTTGAVGRLTLEAIGEAGGYTHRYAQTIRSQGQLAMPPVVTTNGGCIPFEVRLVDDQSVTLVAGEELDLELIGQNGVVLGTSGTCTSDHATVHWSRNETATRTVHVERPGDAGAGRIFAVADAGIVDLFLGFETAAVAIGCVMNGQDGCASGWPCCAGSGCDIDAGVDGTCR